MGVELIVRSHPRAQRDPFVLLDPLQIFTYLGALAFALAPLIKYWGPAIVLLCFVGPPVVAFVVVIWDWLSGWLHGSWPEIECQEPEYFRVIGTRSELRRFASDQTSLGPLDAARFGVTIKSALRSAVLVLWLVFVPAFSKLFHLGAIDLSFALTSAILIILAASVGDRMEYVVEPGRLTIRTFSMNLPTNVRKIRMHGAQTIVDFSRSIAHVQPDGSELVHIDLSYLRSPHRFARALFDASR